MEKPVNLLSKSFNKIYIEITNVCNLTCFFCAQTVRPKEYMSLPVFKKIIDQVKELTDTVAFHVLGEPLLHPELSSFLSYAQQAGLKIHLTTNGTLLNKESCALLVDQKIQQINVSLQAIWQLADKKKYLDNIFSFIELLQKSNSTSYLNLRLWNVLTEDLAELKEIIIKYFAQDVFFPATLAELKKQKSYHLKNKVYLNFDTQFVWPVLDGEIKQLEGFCYGLSAHFGVLVDGTVIPCCLDSAGIMGLGNIKNKSLLEILNSERAQKIKAGFQRRLLVEPLCQRCGYIERFANKK